MNIQDGLLLDSERVYSMAADVILEPYGQSMTWVRLSCSDCKSRLTSLQDLKSKLMGRPQADAVRMFIEYTKIPLTAEEVIEKTHVIQDEMFRKVCPALCCVNQH